MLDETQERPYVLSMINTIRSSSLTSFAQYYSSLTGDAWEFIFAQLLMITSQNLGIYIDIPTYPRITAYPNLFIILIAPPGVHHKSTVINRTKYITQKITELVQNEDYVKSITNIQLAGSMEGFMERLTKGDKIDLYNDEFGRVLSASARGTYETGLLEILNNAYYKKGTASLRREIKSIGADGERKESSKSRDLIVPDGKYITFFGAIHENEMTNEMYRVGIIRRSIIVYLSYESVVTDPIVYDRESNELANAIEEAIVKVMSEARMNLVKWSYQPTYELKMDDNNEYDYIQQNKHVPINFEYSDEAIEFLKELYTTAMTNAKQEKRQLYPNESVELITRIAINIMLWDAMRKEKYSNLVLTKENLIEAKNYMEKIVENYVKAISTVEDRDVAERSKKVYNYVIKKCENFPYFINQSDVMNAVGQKWENFHRENAIVHAIEENKIARFEILYLKKRTGYILCPYARVDDVIAILEKMITEGKILNFKEVRKR